MVVKVKGGYKIRSHRTGKMWPKKYKTRAAAQRRVGQLKRRKSRRK